MNRTKAEIMDVFDQLLEEKPLSRITVKELTDRCGINRNTFYYHFRDIPDLLEYIVKERADEIIRNHDRLWSLVDCIQLVLQYCTAHRRAILHIYRSVRREVFVDALERLTTYAVQEYVTAVIGDLSLDPEDLRLLVRYYKCTIIGVSLDWLNNNMNYDLRAAAVRICGLFAGSTEQALTRAAEQAKSRQLTLPG